MGSDQQGEKPEKILVVDDDPIFLEMLSNILHKNGFQQKTVPSGVEALAIFEAEKPDLVLLDANMPVMDGYEICRLIKKMPGGQHIPIVMVTGNYDHQSVHQAFSAGAEEFISKPINWAVLVHRLQVIFKSLRMEREKKYILQTLEKSEERYRNLVELSPDAIVAERNLRILYANPAAVALIGADNPNQIMQRHIFDFIDKEFFKKLNLMVRRMVRTGEPRLPPIEGEIKRLNGTTIQVEIVLGLTTFQDKTAVHVVIRDISERKRAEQELKLAATVFETSNEAILISDGNNCILKVNKAFTRITGYEEYEVIGKNPNRIASGRHDANFYIAMWQDLKKNGRWSGEIWNRRKNGEVYPEWLSITAIRDSDGKISRYIALFNDITQQKDAEEKVRFQATHDALTKLPNRSLFLDRLQQHLMQGNREKRKCALLFIDLDRFKWVNDTLGHAAGDLLLQITASRLKQCVRAADTVARLGGDEFTIVMYESENGRGAEMVATKIIECLGRAYLLHGHEVSISGSVGITLYPDDANDVETLLKNADSAMYEAKRAGRNQFRFFTPHMNKDALHRLELESDLRRVLTRHQFILYYQPIFSLDGHIAGAEVLLRWNHPSYGLMLPGEFIPIAQEAGITAEITHFVLHHALQTLKKWHAHGHQHMFISVNMPLQHLKNGQCSQLVLELLHKAQMSGHSLILEITEAALVEHSVMVEQGIEQLHREGVKMLLDNFGTGLSSLNTLKRYPLDGVKIDGSFIRLAVGSHVEAVFTHAIINLVQSLNLKVYGTGIESAEQQEFLCSRGCNFMQGFYISRPITEEDFFQQYLV